MRYRGGVPYRSDEARSRIEHVAATGNLRGLPELLPFLPPHAHPLGDQAAAAVDKLLRAASPRDLARLDGWFRSERARFPEAPDFHNLVIGGHAWDPHRHRGVTALATFHWDGRVRDSAVASIAELDDAYTIPVLLVRLNDWVDAVHDRAHAALATRVETTFAEAWASALPLLDRLDTAARRSAVIAHLRKRVDAMLVSPPARAALLAAAANAHDVMVRRAAFMRARLVEDPDVRALVVRAAGGGDPVTATWACKALFGTAAQPGPADVAMSLSLFKTQRSGALRAMSLEAAIRTGGAEASPTLREAIHDDLSVVREVARFALTKLEQWKPADFAAAYKARLASSAARATAGSAEGLAEVASTDELDVLRSLVEHENARFRAAGWVGIGRVDPSPKISDFERALADPSREVRRAVRPYARRLMGKGVAL